VLPYLKVTFYERVVLYGLVKKLIRVLEAFLYFGGNTFIRSGTISPGFIEQHGRKQAYIKKTSRGAATFW
jgi:hypothetical protein